MQTSSSVKEIASALLGFHKQMGKIGKTSSNPFFKSKYADLPTILSAIADPLSDNGLTVVQFPEAEHGLTTRLLHVSGEWMESTYFMHPTKNDPQGAGSVITYQRRYAIGAILNLNIDNDDDGNKASAPVVNSQPQQNDNKPWLNVGSKEFNGTVAKLKEGTITVNTVRQHFKINKEVAELLKAAEAQPYETA